MRVAYRMLGSLADAADMVLGVFIRWVRADRALSRPVYRRRLSCLTVRVISLPGRPAIPPLGSHQLAKTERYLLDLVS